MKYITFGILFIIGLSGCKLQGVDPSTSFIDTSKHHVTINDKEQQVVTTVFNNTLNMSYYENINLLIPVKGYHQSFAVHLYEDFSGASLQNFDFTTVNPDGTTALNWVDNNLNNVVLKTVSDTTVQGFAFVKINVHRIFKFTKTYADAKSADDQQDILLNKQGDLITFSSHIYFGTDYPSTISTVRVKYTAINGSVD